MTNYNSSVLPNTPPIYVHPWYLAVQKLVNTTTSGVESTPKQPPETTGAKPTNALFKEERTGD
jgi:hypothetical protein